MLQYSLFLGNRLGFSKSPWSSREMRLLICVHEEKCFLFCLFVCTKTPATKSEGSL